MAAITAGQRFLRAFALSCIEQGLNEEQRKALRDAAFVPVANATQLMPPSRLFFRMREELPPFSYELPAAFTSHAKLLEQLGCRTAPSPTDLLDILQAGHPNQCDAVMSFALLVLGRFIS